MTGDDPGARVPTNRPESSFDVPEPPVRTIETTLADVPAEHAAPSAFGWRLSGGISLAVALLGLVGAALGSAWLGLSARYGIAPDGLVGGALMLVSVALTVLGLILLVGGLGFYVLAPAFAGPGAARLDVGSHRLVIATTGLIVLLANAGPIAYVAIVGADGLQTLPGFLTAALSVDVVLLGITYLRFIRPGVLTASDLGLNQPGLIRLVGVGIIVGLSILVISALIQMAIQAAGFRQTQLVSLQYIRDFPLLGFLAVVAAGGILAPIAEELFFRGYVFRSYLQTRGPLVAYGGTSVLFATLHLNLPALLPILVLSLILCYAYRRTGSIIPSIVGHALNNTAAFCILYFTNAPL